MRPQIHSPYVKQAAQVTLATLLVAGTPVAAVWWLRESGTLGSALITLLLGMAISLVISALARSFWEKRQGSEDLLFSELMVWGYIHRLLTQRRIADASELAAPLSARASAGHVLDRGDVRRQTRLLERLVSNMETRDPYLHGHSRRVARHATMVARRMKLGGEEIARVRTAAALHDVGKTRTPKSILHKAGPLTDEEYGVIKLHPGDGANMASVLGDPELVAMIRHHHERLDGSGYPDGLCGKQIPLGARIIAVADTFDAITSARPYRAASPHKKAIDILRAEAGTKLDPDVVRAFCNHYAGRGPLALWSFVCSLPERILSWLTASAATVASAAKVVAVAALVGGVAATSSTLGLAGASHARPAHRGRSAAARATTLSGSRAATTPAALRASAGAPARPGRSKTGSAPGHRGGSRAGGVATPHAPFTADANTPVAAGGGQAAASPAREEGGGARSEEHKTSGEQPHKAVSEQAPSKAGSEEPAGKVKHEEPASKAKHEEPASKGKHEEAPAKGHQEESAAKGKTEEAPAHGKSEETPAHGKSEEVAGAKAEEKTAGSGSVKGAAKAEPEPHGKGAGREGP
ncbi:MAG TPA: HD domain-containing phosphohydrolase [Solirubrobacteraceae bacterium]|jgi:putative nucleotidyltransferase with HDIG domain|nr:HD domain-containing phosphohydrolase [Solirubrobacteraceae bacterium]